LQDLQQYSDRGGKQVTREIELLNLIGNELLQILQTTAADRKRSCAHSALT